MSAHGHTPEPPHAPPATTTPAGITLHFADYELDFARSELRRADALVALQPTPLRVLLYLAEHRDRTVPRRELLDAIWPGVVVGDEALTTALAEARHAVGDDGASQRVIRTLKGQGYRFVAEATVAIGSHASANEGALADGAAAQARRRLRGRAWFAAALSLAALAAVAAALWPRTPPVQEFPPFGVAVLPVANLTGAVEDRALADGLTEQITHSLASKGYPVVARTTAKQYREHAADVRALGASLGVSHVLEGSVRRDGERLRITMQLVSTESGKHVWSETFEHAGGDVFATQDRVTDRVADRVYTHVWEVDPKLRSAPEFAQLAKLAGAFPHAFFEGHYAEAAVLGEQLIASAPDREPFLRARGDNMAMLSITWANRFTWQELPLSDAGPKMLEWAQRAVAMAPDSAYTHTARARAFVHHWRWEEAEREMRRACEIAPQGPEVCGATKAHICAALGCVDEQLEGARLYHARVGAANANGFWLPWALINSNRLEEAEAVALRARQADPTDVGFLFNIQWRLGHVEPLVQNMRAFYAAAADSEAQREFAQVSANGASALWRWVAEQQAAGKLVPPNMNDFASAQTYAELGDYDAAIASLEKSIAEHEPGMEMFGLDPIFDPIRDTPRSRALIEQMGLTAYHEKYGVFERARRRTSVSSGR